MTCKRAIIIHNVFKAVLQIILVFEKLFSYNMSRWKPLSTLCCSSKWNFFRRKQSIREYQRDRF